MMLDTSLLCRCMRIMDDAMVRTVRGVYSGEYIFGGV